MYLYHYNHVRRGCAVTSAEVAVLQTWICEQSPGNMENMAGVCTVGGQALFTDVGTLIQINFCGAKPGVSTDRMKQAMGALSFISLALWKHSPIPMKAFFDLPEHIDEEVRECIEVLGVEICLWPCMPTFVS